MEYQIKNGSGLPIDEDAADFIKTEKGIKWFEDNYEVFNGKAN